jgi:glycosyltransferase involved in cell wall biosynthesis
MMAEDILLSIAIPTYNREACLQLLLESICSQVTETQACRLEVMVFDNCSTDQTAQVVERFLPGRSYLAYVRNERNIGADNNFVKAFFAARGQYLWIVGDDELLFDGAIQWVLGLCEGKEFGCAYFYSTPAIVARMPQFLHQKILAPVQCRAYAPYAFAQAANYRLTFLSGSVINKRALLESNPRMAEDIKRFSGSSLVHLSWIFSAVLSKPVSCVVTTPLFAGTIANSGGYNPVRVFVVNLSELFGYYFCGLNADAKRFIRWFALIGWFPKVVFDCRFRDRYKKTGYVIEKRDFPMEMQAGLAWRLFDRFVLNGSMLSSGIAMLVLKVWHKIAQWIYLMRGA